MPAPSAPTSLAVTHRDVCVRLYSSSGGGILDASELADDVLLTCDAVAGADTYVFQYRVNGSVPGSFTSPTPSARIDGFNGLGLKPAWTYDQFQVKARNSSGDSAFYPILGSALTITPRSVPTLACTGPDDLAVPTPIAAVIDGGLVTVTFDYASTDAKEANLFFRCYDQDNILVGGATVRALLCYGSGQTVTFSVPPRTSYTVKSGAAGYTSVMAGVQKLSTTVLSVDGPPAPITPSEINEQAGEPFSVSLAATPNTSSLAIVSAPAGLTLSPKIGTAAQILSGTVADRGVYTLVFSQTSLAGGFVLQRVILTITDLIVVDDEIHGWMGDAMVEMVSYIGTGTVVHWFLSGGPPGIEIAALTPCPGSPYDVSDLTVVALSGSPTAYGIFEATITAQVCLDGLPHLYRRTVRFLISGGLFLDWFHDDPFHVDLQWLLRSKDVKSYYGTDAEVLWLKRGDDAKLYVILRDGPLSTTDMGRRFVSDDVTELRLVIRPAQDYDAEPYFDLGGAPVTEVVGGQTVFVFAFKVTSDPVERAFSERNRAHGADPAEISLPGSAELTMIRGGQGSTSRTFMATISQDVER